MNNRGRISFTVETLHETGTLFDFLEKNFKLIDVDHSDYLQQKTVHLTLEDLPGKFNFIHSEYPYHQYSLTAQSNVGPYGDVVEFRVELI
jgi:hypothetical protein